MTVNDLIQELQHLADTGYEETEVRLAFQPSWPLAFRLRGVTLTGPDSAFDDDDPDPEPEPEEAVVWLVEGGHPDDSPYAPGRVFEI